MEPAYLIRYGAMGRVGRFSADDGAHFDRGAAVVVRSHRGVEMGEVLVPAPAASAVAPQVDGLARILRTANPDDHARARAADAARADAFDACRRVFEGEGWPIELLDVEPLLDDGRLVLHYLGPHRLDLDGLLAVFRERHRYDVMFQPAGRDADEAEAFAPAGAEDDRDHGCGSCGTSGGGCGTGSAGGGCGTSAGCDSCGVKRLIAARRDA